MADRLAIPSPRDDDPEDVFWALSTATTLWNRGERAEALKWLRRAAKQASDQRAEARSKELLRASMGIAAALGPSIPPPPLPAKSPAGTPLSVPPVALFTERPSPITGGPDTTQNPSWPPSVAAVTSPSFGVAAPQPPPARPAMPPPPVVASSAPAPRPPVPSRPRAGRERLAGRRAQGGKRPASIPDTPFDEFDDVTSVIVGKPALSALDADAKPAPTKVPSAKPAAATVPSPAAPSLVVKAPPVVRVTARKGTMQLVDEGFESLLTDGEAEPRRFVEAPKVVEIVASAPPVAASVAPAFSKRALLACRVAVMAGPDGVARVVPLESVEAAPEGAVAAILVPLVAADSEPLARLLGPRP